MKIPSSRTFRPGEDFDRCSFVSPCSAKSDEGEGSAPGDANVLGMEGRDGDVPAMRVSEGDGDEQGKAEPTFLEAAPFVLPRPTIEVEGEHTIPKNKTKYCKK